MPVSAKERGMTDAVSSSRWRLALRAAGVMLAAFALCLVITVVALIPLAHFMIWIVALQLAVLAVPCLIFAYGLIRRPDASAVRFACGIAAAVFLVSASAGLERLPWGPPGFAKHSWSGLLDLAPLALLPVAYALYRLVSGWVVAAALPTAPPARRGVPHVVILVFALFVSVEASALLRDLDPDLHQIESRWFLAIQCAPLLFGLAVYAMGVRFLGRKPIRPAFKNLPGEAPVEDSAD
jgi:hypothetical protein